MIGPLVGSLTAQVSDVFDELKPVENIRHFEEAVRCMSVLRRICHID